MEVIKHGKTHRTICCDECGCQFSFSQIDTCLKENEAVACPECGSVKFLDDKDRRW